MSRATSIIALMGSALALAACGGSSSSTTQIAATNGIAFASGQTADFATLAAIGPITTKAGTAAFDGTSFSGEFQNLILSVQSENAISFSFDGNAVTLTRTGGAGPFTGTIGGTNLTASVTESSSIFFGQVSQTRGSDTEDSETFFVTGFETNPTSLGNASATYTGTANMVARDRAGGPPAVAAGGNTTILNGTMSMNVNFASNQITSGNFTGSDYAGATLRLDLASTSFAGKNNFTTTASKNAGSSTSGLNFGAINVNGAFYGSSGEQVGGTMEGSVTSGMPGGNPTHAAGQFVGAK